MKYYYCRNNHYIYRTIDGERYELNDRGWLKSSYKRGKNDNKFDFITLDFISICRTMKVHRFLNNDIKEVIIDYIEGDLI